MNSSILGAPKPCLRHIHVFRRAGISLRRNVFPVYLYDICRPSNIFDYLYPALVDAAMRCQLHIGDSDYLDVTEPAPPGRLNMDGCMQFGTKVYTKDGEAAAISDSMPVARISQIQRE